METTFPIQTSRASFPRPHRIALLAVALPLLAACVSSRPAPMPVAVAPEVPQREKVWARADGQRMAGNRALTEQGRRDLGECRALAAVEGQPGQYHLPTLNSCMEERGYVEIEKPA